MKGLEGFMGRSQKSEFTSQNKKKTAGRVHGQIVDTNAALVEGRRKANGAKPASSVVRNAATPIRAGEADAG
jgi:hypothetical protein